MSLEPPRAVTTPVTLFGHWICPYSVRVEFALVHLGIRYDVVNVPPTAARPKGFVVPEEFTAHSPKGEIPMIRTDGRYLADSLPILEFLDPAAGPGVHDAARWVDAVVFPPMIGVYYGTDDEKIARAAARLSAGLLDVSERLGPTGWLEGAGAGMAEAALVPFYVRLDGLRRLGFDDALPPQVHDHCARVLDLPAGRAVAWTDDQTDEFVWRFTTFRERARNR